MSGAGLPCTTSSPATVTSNASSRPARESVRCSRSRGLDEAIAIGIPRARSSRAAPTASSNDIELGVDQREQLAGEDRPERLRGRQVDALCEVRVHARVRQPDAGVGIGIGVLVAVRRERPLPREPRQRLGVHQRAVAVEDHGGHRGSSTYLTPSPARDASNARAQSASGTTSVTSGASSTAPRLQQRHRAPPRAGSRREARASRSARGSRSGRTGRSRRRRAGRSGRCGRAAARRPGASAIPGPEPEHSTTTSAAGGVAAAGDGSRSRARAASARRASSRAVPRTVTRTAARARDLRREQADRARADHQHVVAGPDRAGSSSELQTHASGSRQRRGGVGSRVRHAVQVARGQHQPRREAAVDVRADRAALLAHAQAPGAAVRGSAAGREERLDRHARAQPAVVDAVAELGDDAADLVAHRHRRHARVLAEPRCAGRCRRRRPPRRRAATSPAPGARSGRSASSTLPAPGASLARPITRAAAAACCGRCRKPRLTSSTVPSKRRSSCSIETTSS